MNWCFYRSIAAIALLFVCAVTRVDAGNLAKADIERMVDFFYIVGEVQPDLPVYPLFVKDSANPEAKPELKAYVFESIDFAPVRGYSAKPINVLIIMDLSGNFLRVRLLDHREPLFLDSAGTLKLERFASQYKGLSPRHTIEIGPFNDPGLRDEQVAHVKGVQQGTISVKAINRAILTAAAAVATAKLKSGTDDGSSTPAVAPATAKDLKAAKESPKEIVKETAKDTLREVTKDSKADAGADNAKPASASARPAHEITDAGKELRQTAQPAQKSEGNATVSTASTAHSPMPSAAKSPGTATAADNAEISQLNASVKVTQGGDSLRADTPAETNDQPLPALAARTDEQGARMQSFAESASEMQDWINAWQARRSDIAVLLAGLSILSIALIAQKRFSADRRRMRQLRTLFLLFTVGFIGWTAQGQLTIVNITAAIESLTSGGDLGFLMNDPMTVILWVFVGGTLLVWGRGTFCGWLCPFGALQELLSLLSTTVGLKQRRLRAALDAKLKWIKYLILATILGSLYLAPPLAELATEIEPFKTAISLYFMRDWPYVLWALFCLLLSVFIYRGYCRYICPLGAALASVNFLQRWSWIPRRNECGKPCQTCRHRCEYQAIAPSGKIEYRECFQCLDCVSIYQDTQRCFPLIQLNKAGLELNVLKR